MGRVVASLLFHQKSRDVWRAANGPLDWAVATNVGSSVDVRDHIVQGGHQGNKVSARRMTWCRRSRMARRVCAWPGLTCSMMPCSVHHSLVWSELQARCSSTCKVCMGPKCRIQPLSSRLMNSSVRSSPRRCRAAKSLVVPSEIISTGC